MAGLTPKGALMALDDDAGTRSSFEEFVRSRSDDLLRVAWLVTRDVEDARDAVQETLVALYERWDRLPAGDRFQGYVYRSVVNSCFTGMRGRRRTRPVADPQLLAMAPSAQDPARAIANADEAWRLLGELPPNQRAAVVLRFYRDLSFAEIAQVLGCAEATARSHVHRAVSLLRTRVTEGAIDG